MAIRAAESAIWQHRDAERQLFQQAVAELGSLKEQVAGVAGNVALIVAAKLPVPSQDKIDPLSICLCAACSIEEVIANKELFSATSAKSALAAANGALKELRGSQLIDKARTAITEQNANAGRKLLCMIKNSQKEGLMRDFDSSASQNCWSTSRIERFREVQQFMNLLFSHFAR